MTTTIGKLASLDLTQALSDDEYRERLQAAQTEIRYRVSQLARQKRSLIVAFEGWDAAGMGTCRSSSARWRAAITISKVRARAKRSSLAGITCQGDLSVEVRSSISSAASRHFL